MSCEGCAKDVSESLYKLDGIAKVEANVKEQLVRVEGTGMPLFLLEKKTLLSHENSWSLPASRQLMLPPPHTHTATFAHDAFVSSVKAYYAQSIGVHKKLWTHGLIAK